VIPIDIELLKYAGRVGGAILLYREPDSGQPSSNAHFFSRWV